MLVRRCPSLQGRVQHAASDLGVDYARGKRARCPARQMRQDKARRRGAMIRVLRKATGRRCSLVSLGSVP
eukprot:6393348-Pyramimonas_sp.AAC.1